MTPFTRNPITDDTQGGGNLLKKMAIAVFVLGCLGVMCISVSCTGRTRRTPDDTIVMLIETPVRDVDPRFARTNHDVKVSRLIAPGLTTVDQDSLEPKFALAESIERIDDRTWDIVIRRDAVFSNGKPVLAKDVVFTYQSTMKPGLQSLYQRGFLERYHRVEAVSDRRVRFHLRDSLGTFYSDLEFGIVSQQAAVSGKGLFPGGKVIGAGPYQVTAMGAEEILLERNPHYYGGATLVPKLHVRAVRDANARVLMLIGGSADITQNGVRVDLVTDVAAQKRIHVTSGPSALLSYLMFQNEDPILSDRRVRQAIAYAIDRQRIMDAKFHGRAVLATGLLAPNHWAYWGQVQRYSHRPELAKKLLDEAGYPDPDGDGPQPRMQLLYKTSASQFRVAIARILAAQLGQVGIAVEVRAYEFGTFFADVKRGNFQLASMQTADIAEPDYYYSYFHSSRIPSVENPNSGNRWRYRNPHLDMLTLQGRREMERRRRIDIYREVQQILARDVPIVPLWHEDNIAVMNVGLRGYKVLPNARYGQILGAYKETRQVSVPK